MLFDVRVIGSINLETHHWGAERPVDEERGIHRFKLTIDHASWRARHMSTRNWFASVGLLAARVPRRGPTALEATVSNSDFAGLGVPDDLVERLNIEGITSPFPIQTATIPDALAGKDVLGRAPTGSGKTLAFGIPMVARLKKARPHKPTGLILSPTRELAEQIRRELEPLAEARKRSVHAVYGGVGFGAQRKALQRGVDMLVACPGRLLDLIDQGEVDLDHVSYAVVDEADRMADMGFLPVVKRLLDQTNKDRQTVLFSATLGKEVKVLTDRYQRNAVTHEVGEKKPDMTRMKHRFIRIDRTEKVALAAHEVRTHGQSIVFCRTRHGSDRVARQLKRYGVKTGVIHGRRTQNQRDNALAAFVDGKVQVLVATDVAARGIHVDGVDCVVHFDPPEDDKAYTHRSGRTARAGASGVVISFVTSEDLKDTKKLQRQIGVRCEFEDPTPTNELNHGEPIVQPKQGGKGGGGGQKRNGGKGGGKNRNRGGRSKNSKSGGAKSNRSSGGSKSSGQSRGKNGQGKPKNAKGGKPGNQSGNQRRNNKQSRSKSRAR